MNLEGDLNASKVADWLRAQLEAEANGKEEIDIGRWVWRLLEAWPAEPPKAGDLVERLDGDLFGCRFVVVAKTADGRDWIVENVTEHVVERWGRSEFRKVRS